MGNLLWPGRRALVLQNGWFSGRFAEMAAGVGAEVEVLAVPEGQAVCAERVAERLKGQRYDVVTMVQGETSSGVCTVDLPAIACLCRQHGALAVVDAVCTLSTMPLDKDAWGIDVVFTGSQKGLSSLPGVALIAFSDAAWEQVHQHPGPRPHWCLDALRAQHFWQHHQYHYTAPVSGLLALHEALRLVCEETLERRFARHRHSSLALQAGIEQMGLVLARRVPFASTRWWRSKCPPGWITPGCAPICRAASTSKSPGPLASTSCASARWASSAEHRTCSACCTLWAVR